MPAGHGKVREPELSQRVDACLSLVVWLVGAAVVLLNVVMEV